jgi:hypothetical protein
MTTTNVEAKQDGKGNLIPHGWGAAPEISPHTPFYRHGRREKGHPPRHGAFALKKHAPLVAPAIA